MIARLLNRFVLWVAALVAATIPVVDMADMWVQHWAVDFLDDVWTWLGCGLLVWLVRVAQRASRAA